ncbi:M4 family metallopeptidase [Putridiphycobacter roseus]|nr:M4 family metallopeptidase [Putridiphycobacter roseus]
MHKLLLFILVGTSTFFSTFLFSQKIYLQQAANAIFPGAAIVRDNLNSPIPSYVKYGEGNEKTKTQTFTLLQKLYKLNDQVTFQLIDTHTDKLNHIHYKYQQTVGNIPIENGILLLHTKNDMVYAFNGNAYDFYTNTSNPVLSEASALSIALNHLNADQYKWEIPAEEKHLKAENKDIHATYYPKGELVYMNSDPKETPKLAYKFTIYAHSPVSKADYYIDATTQEIIFINQIIKDIDVPGTATTAYSGNKNIVADSFGSNNYRLRESGRGNGVETYDMSQGTTYGNAVDFTDTDNNWNNTNANLDQYATDAHWGSEMTYDYYLQNHNRNSIDGNGFALKNYIHYDVNYNNAFWDGTRMTFGDGNGSSTNPLTSLDISGHEVTHGLTSNTANLVYADESGALNESFSDIFGTCIENFARPSNWNWTVGEDIGLTFRSMSNPNAYGDPDTYFGNNWAPLGGADNGGVHTNSGVQNYWFYLLTDGGAGINDNGDFYIVSSLGVTSSSEIAFRNLTVYLTPNSNFNDARFYAILSAIDLFGPCSVEVEATTNAWYAVGVGGVYVPFTVADFTAADTIFCSAPALVNFQNLSINGINFTWDFGDNTTNSADINPNHTYGSNGNYDVKLVADGGACGIDSVTLTSFIQIDTSLNCVIEFPADNSTLIQTACSGTIYDNGGVNGNYGDQQDGTIIIAPIGADSVRIDFNNFSVESGNGPTCNYDYLEVYDGNSSTAPLIGSYCDNNLPPAFITSSGQALTLVFHSDQALNYFGFDISWNCYLSPNIPVANFNSSDSVSCNGFIQFNDLSLNGPTNWFWDFGDNQTSNIQHPTHTYTTNGTYTVKLVSSNLNGMDSLIATNLIVIDFIAVPIAFGDSICENQMANLSAIGNGNSKWYDAPTNGNLLSSNNNYQTNALTGNSTFYVSDYISGPAFNAAAPSTAIGAGGFFNGEQHLNFNVNEFCILKTVVVNAGSNGNRNIELRDNTGVVLDSKLVTLTTGQQTVTLDFELSPGQDYQLGTLLGSQPDLYRNNAGTNYPYNSVNGEIEITSSSAGTDFYYYFYNWELEMLGCESPRVPVEAIVSPDFDLDFDLPSIICTYETSINLTPTVNGGTWSANCNNCMDSNTGVFNVTNAGIGIWEVTYTATQNCTKTISKNIQVSNCLGLNTAKASNIVMYPNPTQEMVTVKFDQEIIRLIRVVDISGKLILENTVKSNIETIDVSVFEDGLYFIQFYDDDRYLIDNKKLIKH